MTFLGREFSFATLISFSSISFSNVNSLWFKKSQGLFALGIS